MRVAALLLCLAALAWLLLDEGDRVQRVVPRDEPASETNTPGLLGSQSDAQPESADATAPTGRTGTPAGRGAADDEPWPALRVDTVDAYTGRAVAATWNRGTGEITAGPFPPGTKITPEAAARQRRAVAKSLAEWNDAFLASGTARERFYQPRERVRHACTVRPPPGYVLDDPAPRVEADLAAGTRAAVYVLPLWRERILELQVLDPEAQPARDVTVARLRAAGRLRDLPVEVRAAGELRIRGIPHMPGEPLRAMLHWGMPPGPGEEIRVDEIEENDALRDAQVVTTIPADTARPWRLEVRLRASRGPGYDFVETDLDLPFEEAVGLSDALQPDEPLGSARLRVLGRDGRPVPDASVGLYEADARGEIHIPDRRPGAYTWTVSAPGRFDQRVSVEIVAGREQALTVREPVGARLDVQVTDGAGRPRPSATLDVRRRRVFDVTDGVQRLDMFTDAAGRRTFARVEPGRAMIVATWGSRSGARSVRLVDGETKRVTIVVK